MSDDCDCNCDCDVMVDSDNSGSSSGGGRSGGGCFIATAAYGSYSEPHVLTLREFRDAVLDKTALGKVFIRCYYKTSPPIANLIASREYAKSAVRIMLAPIVSLTKMINKFLS